MLSFKTQVMQVRTVRRGCSIGYGNSFTANRDSRIATLSVGYADGLMRALSNCGHVSDPRTASSDRGQNQHGLDVGGRDGSHQCEVGDETVLIGKQGNQEIRVEELAGLVQSIPYEILTRIGARVPRVYLEY